jgi:hypothetical protein
MVQDSQSPKTAARFPFEPVTERSRRESVLLQNQVGPRQSRHTSERSAEGDRVSAGRGAGRHRHRGFGIKTKKADTFFLSNIALKKAKEFYQSIWAALEDHTRDWVFDNRITEARMITGVFFYDPEEDDASSADGVIEYSVIEIIDGAPRSFPSQSRRTHAADCRPDPRP